MLLLIFVLFLGGVLRWTFAPYFAWKKRAKESDNDEFTIISNKGRKPLGEYLREASKRLNKPEYSLIIPAYNESKRLPKMLTETIQYLEKKQYNYEIIVVNDSSKDNTTEVALSHANFQGKELNLKVLEYKINQGKGGAIRSGMMAAEGDVILMVDADGASDINDFEKCVVALRNLAKDSGMAIIAGSRNEGDDNTVQRVGIRLFLSTVSQFIVHTICGVKIKDTQCGFKFFTQKTAKTIFKPMHIRRWAFDVEIFIIANQLNIPYAGVPISWHDVEGSKLNVVSDTLQMTRDYLLIRLLYLLGLWRTHDYDKVWESFFPVENESDRKSPSPGRRPKRD